MQARRRLLQIAITLAALALVAGLAVMAKAWYDSRLPSSYGVMDYGALDFGGGAVPAGVDAGHRHDVGTSVASFVDRSTGHADARFTLTAAKATVRLPSGRKVDALAFNGQLPGPELRVHQGDLVAVTLVNRDVEHGVSIHWHGVDLPNAMDGVAGVTQDAVLPGRSFTYRFRAGQVGTFWYHTHQGSVDEIRRGLFGAFVIEPRRAQPRNTLDLALVAHDFNGIPTLAGNDGVTHRRAAPGTVVRLRLVNSDNTPQQFTLDGTAFRIAAIDGTELNEPTPVEHVSLKLAAGGRYDVTFTMPPTPVRLAIRDTQAALMLSADRRGEIAAQPVASEFDPATYGSPARTPFDARSRYDRHFRFEIGRKPGFLDGKPGFQWTINGHIYPDVPVFVVQRGELVHVDIVNNTSAVHPMHLHGHHMLVLSRDGSPVSGSPWWSDTLDVKPHERYEVAFRANNPGIWMDHCHNLKHAAAGLTMHLAYAGVATPFTIGGATHNHPE